MLEWRRYVTSDPQICHGALCAKGTRVFVTNILDSLAEGASRDEILQSYPSLEPEHIDPLSHTQQNWRGRKACFLCWANEVQD